MRTLWGSSKLHGRLFDQVDDQQIPSKFEIVLSEMNLVMISLDVSMNSPKQSLNPFFLNEKTENFEKRWFFKPSKTRVGRVACCLFFWWDSSWGDTGTEATEAYNVPLRDLRIVSGWVSNASCSMTGKLINTSLALHGAAPQWQGNSKSNCVGSRQRWKAVESCNAFRTLDFRVLWLFLLGFAKKKTGWRAVFFFFFSAVSGGQFCGWWQL